MKIKLPTFKRNTEKAQALALARQSAAFYDIAVAKGGMAVSGRTKDGWKRRNRNNPKIKLKKQGPTPPRTELREKKPKYKPGHLHASVLCERILDQYNTSISRRERRRLARETKTPLALFYNGPVFFRKGGKAQ